jgi:hypothetical protein
MATWQEDARTLLDNLTAAHTAAVDATDDKDQRCALELAQDAASRLAWVLELALMDSTIWQVGDAW